MIYYIIPCVFLFCMFTKPSHKNYKDHIVDSSIQKYNKCKKICSISFIISKVLFEIICGKVFYKSNDTDIKKIGKNLYEVSYKINNNQYKMIVEQKRGPHPVLQIVDDNMEDVTDVVIPYLGHRYDWNGFNMSLSFFGVKSLTFELADGSTKQCHDDVELRKLSVLFEN
jgi:hypothetical protein